jgi:hypothetical protein
MTVDLKSFMPDGADSALVRAFQTSAIQDRIRDSCLRIHLVILSQKNLYASALDCLPRTVRPARRSAILRGHIGPWPHNQLDILGSRQLLNSERVIFTFPSGIGIRDT